MRSALLVAYLLWAQSIAAVDVEGEGTADSPYRITNLEQLQAIGENLNAWYILENDIDATATATWNLDDDGRYRGFEPISSGKGSSKFRGVFDGRGHRITNLMINRPDEDYVGLFGSIDEGAEIINVGLEQAVVEGGRSTGILAGESGGTVSRCYSTGSVKGAQATGGLVGTNLKKEGLIEDCYSWADVELSLYGGGLVGVNKGILRRVYSAGAVLGDHVGVGGLVGHDASGEAEQAYWDVEASGVSSSAQGEGYTTEELFALITFAWSDMADIADYNGETWVIQDGSSYPVLGYVYEHNRMAVQIVAWPTVTALVYGNPLSSSVLSGGQASVAGRFTFVEPDIHPAASGSYPAEVVFIPDAMLTFSPVTGLVSVVVSARTVTLSGDFEAADKVMDGTCDAQISHQNLMLVGVLPGDEVRLLPVAEFSSPNEGVQIVSLSEQSSLSGAQATNYTLSLVGAPQTEATIRSLKIKGSAVVTYSSVRTADLQADPSTQTPPDNAPRAHLEWMGDSLNLNRPYHVQSTSSLQDPHWVTEGVVPRQDGVISWTSDETFTKTKYYRVIIPGSP